MIYRNGDAGRKDSFDKLIMGRNEKKIKKKKNWSEKRPLPVADFFTVAFGRLSGRW